MEYNAYMRLQCPVFVEADWIGPCSVDDRSWLQTYYNLKYLKKYHQI